MRSVTAKDIDGYAYARRYTLSCGHDRFAWAPDLPPALGSVVTCLSCGDGTVACVDGRVIEVYCPDCQEVIVTVGRQATITARHVALRHNHIDRKGHHAEPRESGDIVNA